MTGSARWVRNTVWQAMTAAEVAERYRAGVSMETLGILTGTSSYWVRKTLVAQGVPIRPAHGGCRGHSPTKYVRGEE